MVDQVLTNQGQIIYKLNSRKMLWEQQKVLTSKYSKADFINIVWVTWTFLLTEKEAEILIWCLYLTYAYSSISDSASAQSGIYKHS